MKRLIGILAVLAVCTASTQAQIIYSSGLEDGTGWAIVAEEDTDAQWGWDYSALGLPPAPNGSDTVGLRLASNITDPGAAAGISVSPDMMFSGLYTVQFDFWFNYHTSAGTTEYGGGGVGFDTSSPDPRNGQLFMVNTDGDSGTDYLLFQDGVIQDIASGVYAIPSQDHADPANEPLRLAFPGGPPPDSQNADFGQVLAPNPDGTFGFGWHTMEILVDAEAEAATFIIDGVPFGTVSGDVSGNLALTHWDRFSSVAGVPDLAFGAYDNLVVTQIPEPTSALLLLLGLGLIGIHPRRSR